MSLDAWLLVAIIVFAIAAFVREWLPMDVVTFTSLGLCLVFNLVSAEEAISGFGNTAVITVLMMFILSAGFVHSGLVTKLAYRVSDLPGSGKWGTAVLLLLLAGVVSAFLNNAAAVAVFMPVAIYVARHHRSSPSKLLIPLSYTAIFGGTCTLIGTSTNLLVSSLARQSGIGEFSMFEFLALGGVFFVTGLAHNVPVPMRHLPPRSLPASLTNKYELSGFLTELKVPTNSKLVDRAVVDEQVSEQHQLNILEIIRGPVKISSELRNTPIQADDIRPRPRRSRGHSRFQRALYPAVADRHQADRLRPERSEDDSGRASALASLEFHRLELEGAELQTESGSICPSPQPDGRVHPRQGGDDLAQTLGHATRLRTQTSSRGSGRERGLRGTQRAGCSTEAGTSLVAHLAGGSRQPSSWSSSAWPPWE